MQGQPALPPHEFAEALGGKLGQAVDVAGPGTQPFIYPHRRLAGGG